MAVITISHQIGSHGREIGQKVADKLGLDYIDRQIVQAAATRLGIPEEHANAMDERAQGALQRIFNYLSAGAAAIAAPAILESDPALEEREYNKATQEIIQAAARTNHTIIAGHGANFALDDHHNVLNVFIYAPESERIATVEAREGISHDEATRRVKQNDHDRAQYIKNMYNCNWHSYQHYELMLNSSVITPELAVQLIVEAASKANLTQPK